MDNILYKDLDFSEDIASEVVFAKSKPRIIKNLPIQKTFQIGLRQNLVKEKIAKILDDPVLNEIDSARVEKSEDIVKENKNNAESVDTATQMTERVDLCSCKSLTVSMISNENSEAIGKSFDGGFSDASRDNLRESMGKGLRYTSPMFKTPSLSSHVFKQRINERVLKMNSYAINKYSSRY